MDWAKNYRRENKASWGDISRMIRETVTIDEALAFYCPTTPRNRNRCPCPIHHGKDYNFSYTKTGYKCFVCGDSGDVIALVKEVCELSTRADAMKKLNSDFRLALPIGADMTPQVSTEIAKRRAEAERKEQERKKWWDNYHALLDRYIAYDRATREALPSSDEYAEAVRNIHFVKYKLDTLPPEPR